MIVATNMLESMITNPTPTRAEVSDIAIAVREGTDAVMLSGETAYGQFPFKSVSVMATVAKRTENAMLTYQACIMSCCLLSAMCFQYKFGPMTSSPANLVRCLDHEGKLHTGPRQQAMMH